MDPGVHYQGPLPSPILTVQALDPKRPFFGHFNLFLGGVVCDLGQRLTVKNFMPVIVHVHAVSFDSAP